MIIADNFSYFSLKPYVVTPYPSRLDERVQMRGHNVYVNAELTKTGQSSEHMLTNTPGHSHQ